MTPLLGEGGVYDDFEISSEIDDAVCIAGASNVPVCLTMSRVSKMSAVRYDSIASSLPDSVLSTLYFPYMLAKPQYSNSMLASWLLSWCFRII